MPGRTLLSGTIATTLLLGLSGCGGSRPEAPANDISQDPYGATGAPGSDLTDNGATDGASGLADNGQAEVPLSNSPAPVR